MRLSAAAAASRPYWRGTCAAPGLHMRDSLLTLWSIAFEASRPTVAQRTPERTGQRWLSSHQTQSPGKFAYSVAASYSAKDRPYNPGTHVFHFNHYNRLQQTRNKRLRPESGQDAFFVSRVGDTGGVALGVADGVGGWMESGVDPSDFSHTLCDYTASAAYDHNRPTATTTTTTPAATTWSGSSGPETHRHYHQHHHHLTARQLLQSGYDAVRKDTSIKAGGSTAVVGLLNPDGVLEVANLGDSGFIHLRLNAVHACSEPQVHAFNTPFQLSIVPPSLQLRQAAFGGTQLSDHPRDAEVSRDTLLHGDVLVFASDGLWDNVFNQDILRIVSRTMTSSGAWRNTDAGIRVAPDLTALTIPHDASDGKPAATTAAAATEPPRHLISLQSFRATEITGAAKAASVNTKRDGPFAKEVKKYYPYEAWHGGKVDDICVVVAIVHELPQRNQDMESGSVKSRL